MLETILPIVLSTFLKYVLLSYSSRSKSHGLRTSRAEQHRKYAASCQKRLIRLVHYTESRIVLKMGQYEKMFLQHMTASRRSVALNYFGTGCRIFFTTFLAAKSQLWKLIWAFLGCCMGRSGSPLHLSLYYKLPQNLITNWDN